jgi:hypothetical protein
MRRVIGITLVILWGSLIQAAASPKPADWPANRWVELCRDAKGARPGSAIRFVPETGAFFLWGFMNDDPDLLQEQPLMRIPEYDMVMFDPEKGHWQSHFPKSWEAAWSRQLPLSYIPRTYAGITTGSERTQLRGPTDEPEGAPRPDLNLVFDQVAYHPASRSLFYFTGGLTAFYHTTERRWSDLVPRHTPPPVLGGSLAYDSLHDEMVLFGGGHVAEPDKTGTLVGHAGTWVYRFKSQDWQRLELPIQPPPRMNTRLVLDSRNQVLVLFGGDAQSHYLADTWQYDLKSRQWRSSKTTTGPEARAGHFSAYDPETGWTIIGGGYNRRDLSDMWAYAAARDQWQRLVGEVPAGFYLSADLAPNQRLILLVTSSRAPQDPMTCNILHPVRTTYGYRIGDSILSNDHTPPERQVVVPKKLPDSPEVDASQESARRHAQALRLANLPQNQWVLLAGPERTAPTRTWGSATFDTDRGQILYWGGEHCGYEGNDVDAYDVAAHTWRSGDPAPEYPERLWNHGVRLAGVTFQGKPWTVHGRKMYAYDPVSRKMIMTRPIQLTTGYDPKPLRLFPVMRTPEYQAARDALVNPPSSYGKHATWTYDPDTKKWGLLGPAPRGVDTLLSTPHGVMGVNVNWRSRLNDAGYQLPWDPAQPAEDKALFLLDVASGKWKRLGPPQPSPQNLYEQTSLAYDEKRRQVLLHGAGKNREELWVFEMTAQRWKNLRPQVVNPRGGTAPACSREAVCLPEEDLFLTLGDSTPERKSVAEMWAYEIGRNAWSRVEIGGSDGTGVLPGANQNRALVYDPARKIVFLVLGSDGDEGQASVYALKYRHNPSGR